jgi:hypothetical protein
MDDGGWILRGSGGLSAETAADLVLITAGSATTREHIVAFAAPLLPDVFFEREFQIRKYPEHYLGWKCTVHPESLPPEEVTLRAYIFESGKQRVRPIEGAHKFRVPSVALRGP